MSAQKGLAAALARYFIHSKLTPIAIIASILLGMGAVFLLPREEEPQIQVPMVDVMVSMPGASPSEVEARVTRPMEKLLWEIPGVEYVYSTSGYGSCLTVVRFKVGENLERSLVRLNQKLQTNYDRIPHGVSFPLIKPHTIDDVPIFALTLHGKNADHFMLRRLAAQIEDGLKSINAVAETKLIGGARRQIRVQADPIRLASRNLSLNDLIPVIKAANQQRDVGSRMELNQEILIQSGQFLATREDVESLVVGLSAGKPVYLREVATIREGAEELSQMVLMGSISNGHMTEEPAVTISVAKKPGANAVTVVTQIREYLDTVVEPWIPADVTLTVSRDYGATAKEKSDELLLHMGIAIFGVTLLILFFLGYRESLVVLLAIPATLALTLMLFYLYGYTLNRITLFALIFSIGILVDDAIVVVENIVRHLRLPGGKERKFSDIAIEAVAEVGNPTVLATWAVIAAILPMAFVRGLMGPYMRPIPIGASAAMLFSLIIAFTVTPWAAVRILGRHTGGHGHHEGDALDEEPQDWSTRLYHRIMDPLLSSVRTRWFFLSGIVSLLVASMALVLIGGVKVKMLPFDNKSEFQVIINTDEGTTLESTAQVAREIAQAIAVEPEVEDYQIYAGTAAPFNFNGLVRHYFMRQGPTVADVQVNLKPKHERSAQSHTIAKRIRERVEQIGKAHGARVAITEVPPGPPVLQTLVAEVYGPTLAARMALATEVKALFERTEGVVDVDWFVEENQSKQILVIDKVKAALHGISEDQISRTLQTAFSGTSVDLLHISGEIEDTDIILELPRSDRNRLESVLSLNVRSEQNPNAPMVPLREVVTVVKTETEPNIYHKNLLPVVYVTADVGGTAESPIYPLLKMHPELAKFQSDEFGGKAGESVEIYHLNQPRDTESPAVKWDGEWHVTLEVFRDLGLAFAVVLVLIYMLMVGWFESYSVPLVVMAAIPFSLIGILPAHWGMGAFFTATSMIGFMAGAGIVVRNSIILVDFIELRLAHGEKLEDAVTQAGAIRFRPMLLTALAVVVGASVILADPIFQGLAISLMFGEIASLLISRMAVPVLYFMLKKHQSVQK
jgi:multidrug efflux pump subunit AcrB